MNRLYIRLIIAFIVITLLISGGLKGFDAYQNSPTTSPPLRTNEQYQSVITSAIPSLLDKNSTPIFTVISAQNIDTNWTLVTIKSNQNNDTLRSLVYDPTRNPDNMQLVLAPSKTLSRYEKLPTQVDISLRAINNMNKCSEDGC